MTDVRTGQLANHLVRRYEAPDLVRESTRREVALDVVVLGLSCVVTRAGELDYRERLTTIGAEEGL